VASIEDDAFELASEDNEAVDTVAVVGVVALDALDETGCFDESLILHSTTSSAHS
jgi:hypothetical protein